MSEAVNKMNLPLLFPCATKVQIPQMGSEEGHLGPTKPKVLPPFLQRPKSKTGPVSRQYIKKISADMVFSEDVVKERCFHMMPYDEKYFYAALKPGELILPPPRSSVPTGRHNNRTPGNRHMPCHLRTVLKQLKNTQALTDGPKTVCKKSVECTSMGDKSIVLSEGERSSLPSPFFLTESNGQTAFATKPADVSQHEWDAYLMSLLSSTTAYWIVHKQMSPCEHQTELSTLLKSWYGEPEHTDLIREDTSEKDLDSKPDKAPRKQWKKSEANLLDCVYGESVPDVDTAVSMSSMEGEELARKPSMGPGLGVQDSLTHSIDPYSEDNNAPFYRQPAGIRRQKRHEEKEEAAGINWTARDITVKSYQPPQPVTLRDVVTPRVGTTLYNTDNLFQQEWLTGVEQVSNLSQDRSKIVMASDNMYEKQLQTCYPRRPESWYPDRASVSPHKPQPPPRVPPSQIGMQKWSALPKPIDDRANVLSIIAPDFDPDLRGSPDPIARRTTKQNMSMMKILEEWRTQWHLAGQYADSTPEALIHDMADIQPHVRLKAVATVAKAVSYKPPTDPGIQLETDKSRVNPVNELPEKIFRALEYLLNDKHEQVKKAAAIALYSMERPNQQAENLMREAIKGENSADRWAAAQCLAHYGLCDAMVVGEIIKQLLTTEDSVKHERAISLLSKISADSMLVHSMVAEHLNSSSWRHKVIACKVFPTLKTNINKDITQKLVDLMWNDWHKEVRSAAATALGKTGHGKVVHDALREKILFGPERMRLEAIYRIGQLGIMTARLLPSYLRCFDDQYVSVRCEACITAGRIGIKEEAVIKKLLYRATYDPTWKVKALAVQTLGKIGESTPEIKSCLLWAMRYEDKEAVRAEACHSLIALGQEALDCDDLIEALQERQLVETSDLVKQQISDALKLVGINASDDVDMVADIKNAVRKLCTKDNIAEQISSNEAIEFREKNKLRMIQKTLQESPKLAEPKPHESSREEVIRRMKKRMVSPLAPRRPISQGKQSSKGSTPDLSRENTMNTPTVEKEIQDVMSKENTTISTSDSRSLSPSTPHSKKSRTRGSSAVSIRESSISKLSGETKHHDESTDTVEQGSSAGEVEQRQEEETVEPTYSQCIPEETPGAANATADEKLLQNDEEERLLDDEQNTLDAETQPEVRVNEEHVLTENETCEVSAAEHVYTKPREHFKLALEEKPDAGTGVQTRSSSRRKLINQELKVERNKVQLEAVKSYNNLDMRYSTMMSDLTVIDDAFNPNKSPEHLTSRLESTPSRGSASSESIPGDLVITIPVFEVSQPSGSDLTLESSSEVQLELPKNGQDLEESSSVEKEVARNVKEEQDPPSVHVKVAADNSSES